MRSTLSCCVGILTFFIGHISADTTIVNYSLDYTIYLPDNWVLEETSDSQHIFYDTTFTFGSSVSIVRYNRDTAYFATPEEWTMTHFIAYKLVTETSADPWGAVLYYDSSSASRQGYLWAPEIYSIFFSLDTSIGAWAEFTRFTSWENYGYELYALGDTTDMMANLATYGAIIYGIELPGSNVSIKRDFAFSTPNSYRHPEPSFQQRLLNVMGRKMGTVVVESGVQASNLIIDIAKGIYLTIR